MRLPVLFRLKFMNINFSRILYIRPTQELYFTCDFMHKIIFYNIIFQKFCIYLFLSPLTLMSCELVIPVHNYILHHKNNKLTVAPRCVLLCYQLRLIRLVGIFSQHTV